MKPDWLNRAAFPIAVVSLLITGFLVVTEPDPEVVTEKVRDPYVPPVCVRALQLADMHVGATDNLVGTLNRVAPLLNRAYQAGLDGDDAGTLRDRVKEANGDVAVAYREANRLSGNYDLSVARCLAEANR
jgi:hypothetical protein